MYIITIIYMIKQEETRYIKVINDFPGSILEVGQEIYWPYGRIYATEDTKVDPSDYPHLFEVIYK